MTIDDAVKKIGEVGIIPVIRAANPEEGVLAVEAVLAGGISIVEITMTVPKADVLIQQLVRRYRDEVLIGAGTVLTSEQAKRCLDSGAAFLVSPGLSASVLSIASAYRTLAIPGALTPTELMNAHELGAKLVKIFPCGSAGGPNYLKALRAPFPDAQLIPTGGVNVSSAADYLAAGAFALGVGGELVDLVALRKGNSAKIVATARHLIGIVQQSARGKCPIGGP